MVKSGYLTTEFYSVLLSYVVSILALFKVAIPANMPDYVQAIALLASGVATVIYTRSRQSLKAEAIKASGVSPSYSISTTNATTVKSEIKPEDTV
jgi:hypothetical protein